MNIEIHWPDEDEVSVYDLHDFSDRAINEFQAVMKTVALLSQEWDVIMDKGVITFVDKE